VKEYLGWSRTQHGPVPAVDQGVRLRGLLVETERILRTALQEGVRGWRFSQADKCTWWMPWHEPAMKDVASCEKPRGAASEH
jgi:hypothetical protein